MLLESNCVWGQSGVVSPFWTEQKFCSLVLFGCYKCQILKTVLTGFACRSYFIKISSVFHLKVYIDFWCIIPEFQYIT